MEDVIRLTDEEVDAIAKTAEETNAGNESIQQMKEAKEKPIEELVDESSAEEDKNISLVINPVTGQTEGVSAQNDGYGFDRETDLFDDFDEELNPSTEVDKDFTDSQIERALHHNEKDTKIKHDELSIKDIEEIRQTLIKKNEKGSINYSDLPEFLKPKVDRTVRAGLSRGVFLSGSQFKLARNMLSNSLTEEILQQITVEKINDVCVDLNTSIKNLVKNEYSDIYADQHKQELNTFIVKLPELAETKYANDPKKKELLMAVSNGYKQAHSLEEMYEAYIHGGKKMKIRHIDLEDISKIIIDFEGKYKNSNFTIRDINKTEGVLLRFVNSRFTERVVKGFIIAFCKYTSMMKPSNQEEHTFMYYFINNILSLDVPTTDKDDIAWRDEFLDNINHFMAAIADRIGE